MPNLPVLGPKFKGNKAFGDVKTAIGKLSTAELEKLKETGKIQIAGHDLDKDDILIKEKFLIETVQDYEAIGGDKVIVLLDTRQNEELKIRGFAREIVNRVQKLKKKARTNPEDSILVFYKFGENAKNLNEAIAKEFKTIANSVKKPFLPYDQSFGLVTIAEDSGLIEKEEYWVKLVYPGFVFNFEELKVQLCLF